MSVRGSILLADDEEKILKRLGRALRDEGHEVVEASNAREAQRQLAERAFDLFVVDNLMPGMTGLELIREVSSSMPESERPQIVMMTAHGSTQIVREAFKLGVEDFLEKPFEVDELLVLARRAVKSQRLQTEKQYLLSERDAEFNHYGIVGRSRAMQDVITRAELVAATKSTVLITGETGTGKEMVARLIHHRSAQRDMPLIKVNCAAIPDTLLESELFGHVRGAFTGATMTKRGKFALADGGSIFLDEIGTMSTAVQAKLLRVLQEREFEPLGAERTQRVDVRVVAATNRDLKQMVSDGRFQEDLYYRLNVIPIEIPPLRDRRDDIPTLIDHFVEKHRQRSGKRIDRVEPGRDRGPRPLRLAGQRARTGEHDRAGRGAGHRTRADRAVDLAARGHLRPDIGTAVNATASEPGMGGARDHPARPRTGQRCQKGCSRADGHQPTRAELLSGEVSHRLTTPHEVSTPVSDYQAGKRSHLRAHVSQHLAAARAGIGLAPVHDAETR